MKELSIEQKAKAYYEAKARMSRAFNSKRVTIGFMNEIFPELREDEDERIRKVLIDIFSSNGKKDWRDIPTEKIIGWLEKQGEQHSPIDINKMVNEFAHTEVKWNTEYD